jgi:hypothetical protein
MVAKMARAKRSDDHLGRGGGLTQDDTDASRREILAKIGQFAYAAPALALLAEPKAVDAYGKRPGYGYGDQNHEHSGPRGYYKKNK